MFAARAVVIWLPNLRGYLGTKDTLEAHGLGLVKSHYKIVSAWVFLLVHFVVTNENKRFR